MSTQSKTLLTPEEYLEIERKAQYKSEYYDGEMYAMAGATLEHNLLVTNLIRELSQKLREKPCEVYPSDMRVRVTSTTFVYPDVMVICRKPQLLDQHFDTLTRRSLPRFFRPPQRDTTAAESLNSTVPLRPWHNTFWLPRIASTSICSRVSRTDGGC